MTDNAKMPAGAPVRAQDERAVENRPGAGTGPQNAGAGRVARVAACEICGREHASISRGLMVEVGEDGICGGCRSLFFPEAAAAQISEVVIERDAARATVERIQAARLVVAEADLYAALAAANDLRADLEVYVSALTRLRGLLERLCDAVEQEERATSEPCAPDCALCTAHAAARAELDGNGGTP
jgi:hypothetical protein